MNKIFNKKNLLILAILIGGYYFFTHNPLVSAEIPKTPTIDSTNIWWNDEFAFRQEVTTSSSINQIIELNHAQMVIDGKSNANGDDLKIIAQKEDIFRDIEIDISRPDKVNTKIKFQTVSSPDLKYFLYYGNKNPSTSTVLGTTNITESGNTNLGKEESPEIALLNFKKWILKENGEDSISFKIDTKKILTKDSEVFAIVNDKEDSRINAQYDEGNVRISSQNLSTGVNKIFLVIKAEGKSIRTNSVSFNYSLPLYVTWTIDWEGTIPDAKYLDMMEKISEDFSVPMTQYFNPRIYTSIRYTDSQRKEASDWLKRRLLLGDDIGMHMHMQHDLVEEAGVKAKYTAPTWDNGISGYDTPSTAYNYDEYLKMLNWGENEIKTQIKRFTDYNIPDLQGYRAGGWFANLETLKAIKDAGFKYDTSGRVAFPIGGNKMMQPWNLQTTTQPYYISEQNQNSDIEPVMDLLEIPNNGSDSYWSSDKELIDNFYQNYKAGEILEDDKLVVYLSHPDWFYIDEPKINLLFKEISKYKNDLDNGPVKFVTMKEYLEKSEYINALSSAGDN